MGPREALPDDVAQLAEIVATGFFDDPVMNWLLPDHGSRHRHLSAMMTGLSHNYLSTGGTVHLLDDVTAAFWRDPHFDHHRSDDPGPDADADADSDDDVSDDVSDDLSDRDPDHGLDVPADTMERLGILSETMAAAHPHEAHWYLNIVATSPGHQGRGFGRRVLAPVLAQCDADGIPAYLESTNPRNISLYRRLGFVETGTLPLTDGPSLIAMWREPDPSATTSTSGYRPTSGR